jgi:hypothetical protein
MLMNGCTPSPPPIVLVEGVVTLNGKPLPHAEVQFVPLAPALDGSYIATAITDEEGRYKLECRGQPGGCACENIVTVAEGPLPEDARGQSAAAQMKATRFLAALKNRPIPERFATVAQSPLRITVTEGTTDYPLELSR